MTEKPTGGLDGLYKGSEALATAIVSGAQGIVQKPMTGAKVGGFQGFLKGTAQGILGSIVKPFAGVVDFISKST